MTVFILAAFFCSLNSSAQIRVIVDDRVDETGTVVALTLPQEDKKDDVTPAEETAKENVDEGPVTDTAAVSQDETQVDDKFIRFHMWDGSIVGGEIKVDKIDVQTEFGVLEVPINKIAQFHPGLNSIPALNEKITSLVEGLGDRDFDIRETSHRELVAMGIQIHHEIQRFDDGGSAERKKHLQGVRKEIQEMIDERDELEEPSAQQPLIRGDTIVTREFSIVGKILQDEFRLVSKFGELAVPLGDIKMADRTFGDEKSEVRKTVEVSGTSFFQNKPVSTHIRVNRGDQVFVRASGIVQWTNWSTSSGPDGINNQGQWQGMDCGTLAARIGNSDKYIKVGSKGEFTVKQSGVLYLGVAMRDNYASNNGYKWEGGYEVKVRVKPSSEK